MHPLQKVATFMRTHKRFWLLPACITIAIAVLIVCLFTTGGTTIVMHTSL